MDVLSGSIASLRTIFSSEEYLTRIFTLKKSKIYIYTCNKVESAWFLHYTSEKELNKSVYSFNSRCNIFFHNDSSNSDEAIINSFFVMFLVRLSWKEKTKKLRIAIVWDISDHYILVIYYLSGIAQNIWDSSSIS